MTDESIDTLQFSNQFPSPLLPKKIMDLPKTGKAVADAIYNSAILGTNSYYNIRNSQMAECRTFGAGKQPYQTYLDLLGVDGKQSFLNLDYHPRPVAPKFRNILVNDIMNRLEAIDCTGLSLDIQNRKDGRKAEAAFKMEHGDFINEMEKTSGMQFTQKSDFVPENDDELDLWAQLNDKEKEEMLMEEGIDFILYNNDGIAIKKEVAEDLVDTGFGWTYKYFDGRSRIRRKRIRPEYMVYGTTNTLNFRNMPYLAHLERMAITDVRCMYPNYPEKKLWSLAYQSQGLYGNPDGLVDFIVDFNTAYTRPYDSYLIDVIFFEYKVVKTIDYVKGKDKNGNPIFDINKKVDGSNPNKRPFSMKIPTIYKGAALIGAEDVLEWGEMKNLIRNNEDVEDLQFSYSGYMLNNDGDMLPLSPMQAIRSSIIQMDLAILKMQHTLATTPPNGMKMDLDAITELDLGSGLKNVGPMKLREIWLQTGDVYYSSSKISGDNANRNPIEQNINEIGNKLEQFIGVYNFELNCIRDYIGINEVKDGSDVNPRLGLGVMQGQVQASNTATAHIYNGWVSILTDDAKCVGTMLWDALKSDYTNPMYIKLLGKQNADFIKYNKELTKSNYDIRITVNMSQQDRAFLEQNIDSSIQSNQIELEDALMVRKYAESSIDYAIRYLSFIKKKRMQLAQKQQMALAQQQQQATAALSQEQMKQKQAEAQMKYKQDVDTESRKATNEHILKIQDLINSATTISMQYGVPLPQYVQIAINKQLTPEILAQYSQIQEMEGQLTETDIQVLMGAQQAKMQQEAMQAQSQQQAPQNPQEQPVSA